MSSNQKKLLEKGFILSEEALSRVDKHELDYESALNTDLKEISAPFFPSDVDRRSQKMDSLSNPSQIVLQVKSIKNTSVPKIEEGRSGIPRCLRVALTDGFSVMHAVELSPLENISLDTPPGTKVRLLEHEIKISSGFIVLKKGSIKVLGGHVDKLAESWEHSRKFSKFTREANSHSGPPPWVPFGKEMVIDAALFETATKNLENNKIGIEEKPGGELSEFNSQRQDAIEEAAKSGNNKVFGGGKQEIKDGKRSLSKREEINLRRKGKHGNKENEGDASRPPPSSGLCLSAFIPHKRPSITEEGDDEFEAIPPELQAQFDREAKMLEAEEASKRNSGRRETSYNKNPRKDNTSRGTQNDNTFRGQQQQTSNHSQYSRGHQASNQHSQSSTRGGHQQSNSQSNNSRGQQSHNQNSHSTLRGHQPSNQLPQSNARGGHQPSNQLSQSNSRGGHQPSNQLSDGNSRGQQTQNNSARNRGRNDNVDNNRRDGRRAEKPMAPSQSQHQSKQQTENHRQQQRPPNRSQRYENSDQDFGEWTNSTYTETQDHHQRKHYGESRTFSSRRNMGHKAANANQKHSWKIGDVVLARYWEDEKYYPVTIKAVGEITAGVLFEGYGNIEEVLFKHIRALPNQQNENSHR